ncbi:MAG: hypothetical protein KDI11_05025, partial [Alphaproteobacteria bacterium]|nr:hypothetical protein [Alphaproteobacteria bacterium]
RLGGLEPPRDYSQRIFKSVDIMLIHCFCYINFFSTKKCVRECVSFALLALLLCGRSFQKFSKRFAFFMRCVAGWRRENFYNLLERGKRPVLRVK